MDILVDGLGIRLLLIFKLMLAVFNYLISIGSILLIMDIQLHRVFNRTPFNYLNKHFLLRYLNEVAHKIIGDKNRRLPFEYLLVIYKIKTLKTLGF